MMRIALIGSGAIAEIHARTCREMPGIEVTWVTDLDLGRAEALAAMVGARASTDSAGAIASVETDAVIVAVPTPAHREIVELAAMHGKAVLCEKPLARTMADAETIVAACERAGVRLMVGQIVRYFPAYQRVHAALQADAVGRPGLVRASRVGPHPGPDRAWFWDKSASGGVVLDLMIHELDFLRWCFGDVSRIYASGPGEAQQGLDYAQAALRFDSGVIAHVEASWAHAAFRTTIELAGERGILSYDSEASSALRIDEPGAEGPPAVSHRDAYPIAPWRAQLQHFIERLADGAPFLVSGDDGLRAVELALAVRHSIVSGHPVHFENGRVSRAEVES